MSASSVIVCHALSKAFRSSVRLSELARLQFHRRKIDALRGIDLELNKGEVLGILGPNGAGKTTLLKLCGGLLVPDEGTLSVLGKDVRSIDDAFRHRVSYAICDERSFAWRLTGRQNLRFFAALYGLRRMQADQRIDDALTLVDLRDAADRPVREYSTGMKQRLALARSQLSDAELFLFDEPTRGLDPRHAFEFRALMQKRLAAGRSALIATHDLHDVAQLCTRVVVMEQGKIVHTGSPEDAAKLVGLSPMEKR